MVFDPFEIIGTWKLTSEESDELLAFKPDGTYRIYYEVPFRIIELGEWQILKDSLILICCNVNVRCKINQLKKNYVEFIHLSDTKEIIKDNYKRIK